MKVQIDNTIDLIKFGDVKNGETFMFSGGYFIKTDLVKDNNYYAINLRNGSGWEFFDTTEVQHVRLMVVPEK